MYTLVKEVTAKELQQLLDEGKTVVCDFWASWCGPCRMLAPVMDSLAGEFIEKAEFVKVNVDEEGEAAQKYGVMSIPNVLILKGDKVVANNLGFVPEAVMRNFLKEHL